MTRFLILPLLLVMLTVGSAQARITRIWTYQNLVDEADVVVIAAASETKVTENTDKFMRDSLDQVETMFEVRSVLKGKVKEKGRLQLVHFVTRNNKVFFKNGPQLVHFRTGKKGPTYLLFLKRRDDGKYEAVSGQMDPIYSVKALASPNSFSFSSQAIVE